VYGTRRARERRPIIDQVFVWPLRFSQMETTFAFVMRPKTREDWDRLGKSEESAKRAMRATRASRTETVGQIVPQKRAEVQRRVRQRKVHGEVHIKVGVVKSDLSCKNDEDGTDHLLNV
jgi:hypothetical protein